LTAGQLSFGAPVSITNYIGQVGDGVHANWLERLTSKQKTFAVPVSITEGNSFTLGDGSPLSQMKLYSVNLLRATSFPRVALMLLEKQGGLLNQIRLPASTHPGG